MKQKIETTEAMPLHRRPMSRTEAEADGFTVDTGVYPWFAYKGQRMAPTDRCVVMTDAEAVLFDYLTHQVRTLEHFGFIYGHATMRAKEMLMSIGSMTCRGQRWVYMETPHEPDNTPV